jgi:hypothetical protein
MYSVRRQIHPQYGPVVEITREDDGLFSAPFLAEQQARKEHQKWREENILGRFLIDDQILDLTQLEKWSHEEYRDLPKCQECGSLLLLEEVFPHRYSDNNLFCSQNCSNTNYHRRVDHLNDYEECDL